MTKLKLLVAFQSDRGLKQPSFVDLLLTSGFSAECKIRGALRKSNDGDKRTFRPITKLLRIILIPPMFPPRQNNTLSCSRYNPIYRQCGYIPIYRYTEDNVDTSIYQETHCPGNVDTSLYRGDNVDTSTYWDTRCLDNVDSFLYIVMAMWIHQCFIET